MYFGSAITAIAIDPEYIPKALLRWGEVLTYQPFTSIKKILKKF